MNLEFQLATRNKLKYVIDFTISFGRSLSSTDNLTRKTLNAAQAAFNVFLAVRTGQAQIIMTSEISRIGRRVVYVLNFVELLHEKGIALYIQQFNMLTMENGKDNPVAKMLLQMLSIGAEMENSQRKIRQQEGIQLV
jgi:DNA invertase Pin-like site-specific DNA recombinase